MNYRRIFLIKESEKATVELADVEGVNGPAIVKHLKGANPDIYRLLCCALNVHIPRTYLCEEQGEDLLIVEEYVDGENLKEHLRKQLNDNEKLELALQLCEAVKVLHSMVPPVIHRDIKPSNILITGKGILKLIDFDASRQYKNLSTEEDTRLLGTRGYAAPEQFGYAQTDVRSDIYSMGIVFHEMKMAEHTKTKKQWEKIIEKCTSFDPKNRFQSVQELEDEIKKIVNRKRNGWIKNFGFCAMAVVVLAIAVTAVLHLLTRAGQENEEVATQRTHAQELTATSAPVSAGAPTLIPTPTVVMELSPTLIPTPTVTIAPSPTSAETLTPVPEVAEIPTEIDHFYYKGLAKETEVILHHGSDDAQLPDKWDIECYDYATGKVYIIPMEEIEMGPGYIRLLDSGLYQLEASIYNFTVNMYYGTEEWKYSISRVIQIYGETDHPEEFLKPMRQASNYFYKDDAHDIIKEINSAATSKFAGVFAEMEGTESFEVSAEWYNLFCDGKVLSLNKEFLLQYFEAEQTMYVTFCFDDGKQQVEEVIFKEHSPWINND